MKTIFKSSYPEMSEILSAKEIRRQTLAALPWEEKVSIIVKMQKLLPKGKWKDVDSLEEAEGKKQGGTRQPNG